MPLIARVLLSDPVRLLTAVSGLLFLLLVLAGSGAALQPSAVLSGALALTGWTLVAFGPRLVAALDRWLRARDELETTRRVMEHLLAVDDQVALQNLWRDTVEQTFAPSRWTHETDSGDVQLQGNGALRVPAVIGGAWKLAAPRRVLDRYDARDAAMAARLWTLFAEVDRALHAYSEGQRAARAQFAQELEQSVEAPLRALAARADAVILAPQFEACISELETVRQALDGTAQPLSTFLADLAAEFARRLDEAGIVAQTSGALENTTGVIEARRAAQLRRIVREATTNLIRHAGAQHAWLALAIGPRGGARVVIEDDGRGVDADGEYGGQGLRNMRRRAESVGAHLAWSRRPGGGTRIELSESNLAPEA